MLHLPEDYERITRGRAEIIVHGRYRDALLAAGIDAPDRLLAGAGEPAAASGRGAVPAVPIPGFPGERMMIRRYLRGGLVRFLNRDRYFDGQRALKELAITVAAARSGIATVDILAAVSVKTGPFYRLFLFSKELPGCLDLPAYLRSRTGQASFAADKRTALEQAARLVRRMHDAGFYHADLNMKNILACAAAPSAQYIIDWDKSSRPAHLDEGSRKTNMVRFCRSMLKLAGSGLPVDDADTKAFLRAYRDDESFVQSCSTQLQRAVARRRKSWKLLNR